MKKTTIILTVLLIGCGTKTTDTVTTAKNKESIMQNSTKAPAWVNNEVEDFNEFFKTFTTDSLFQIERVKFPWTVLTWESGEDAPMKELINKEDWRFSSFHYEDSYATRQLDAYTQKIRNYGDTIKLELRGVDNGILIDYNFVKDRNKWFLVSETDYSN